MARRLSLALLAVCLLTRPLAAEPVKKVEAPPPALEKPAPESLDDLKAIQQHVKRVLEVVSPSVVGVQVGNAQGSGVIIKDKYVLTAGHVSGQPGRECTLILPDGTRLKGKTLGQNVRADSGLIEITEGDKYPSVEMGDSAKVEKGQWVLALGHPGGYKPGRPPVVRLGRVLRSGSAMLRTDCTLVGGDSGGPLFDMDGKVVGIHSSIGGEITANNHVAVNTFGETWDRLAKGESWGGFSLGRDAAYLGVTLGADAKGLKVSDVTKDSPADKSGFKADDVMTRFDGKKVADIDDLGELLSKKKPGDEVAVEVLRGDKTVTLKVKLGRRG
jgi:serine protease Do